MKKDIEEITFLIRHAMFEVQKNLGPGLLESVYEEALLIELHSLGLKAESQVRLPVVYKGQKLKTEFRIDILVEDCVIIELKSVEFLERVHYKQLVNYLKLTNVEVGFLVNFNSESLDQENLKRVINPYCK